VQEDHALGWLALVAAGVVVWLAAPFVVSLLLGALMAFTLEPTYIWVTRRHGRPLFWSLTLVLATGVLVVAVAAGFIALFVTRLGAFADEIRGGLQPGGSLATYLDNATRWLGQHGITSADFTSRLQEGAGEIASRSAQIAAQFAAGTFRALLGLFFALLSMYVVLRYWSAMVSVAAIVAPLKDRHARAVLDEFRRAGRATLAGTVITGIAQGVFAGIGYWMSGMPQPAFFGAATAVASLLPGVGTLLVWVPAGIFLVATGHAGKATLELIWCALTVIGVCDYVIRPKLVGDEDTPAILVFIALFGGLELLGLSGLIVGPILMSIAVATLRLYTREEARIP
jgi:predicted PurR-regulated permease PerM